MKNTYRISIIVGLLFTLFSFTTSPPVDSNFIGTYGLSENDASGIELKLNEDQTFAYKDFSDQKKPIHVTGKWEIKNEYIILTEFDSDYTFHTKWRIEQDGQVAKSRKGITFYTLMKAC